MLIDAFSEDWIDTLEARAAGLPSSDHLFMVLDGAFVPGLHSKLSNGRKTLLFASRPGCTQEAADVSPFLTQFHIGDKALRSLLAHCNRWPMVSAIETSEAIEGLANRLSAWCVVGADQQRFNFRFPDTRRLPAVLDILKPEQRGQIAGPAGRWSLIGRDGRWCDFDLVRSDEAAATDPALDALQFAALVEDSLADEILMLLVDRGREMLRTPSASHALLGIALRAAGRAALPEPHLVDWCDWFWQGGQRVDDPTAASMLETWRNTFQ